jgi:CRISPR-associated endonuclease Cas1
MAATQTVAQLPLLRNQVEHNVSDRSHLKKSILRPNHGVITLSGYGIAVRVDRGHLTLEDGIGENRRQCKLPRVDHGLKRLVVIGSDGNVSLAALRWLADQDASFIMLDRDGSVLVTTGPVRSSDARLRRTQAMALQNGNALRISREIIDRKLARQASVAAEGLRDEDASRAIGRFRSDLARASSIDSVRLIESQGAKVYWSAWRALPIMFPKSDLQRVPEHWRIFGSRVSPLTGSPRLATNPANAILNYLYAVLESEARLAAATLGLDPGIGVLHVDTRYRDSLACDLMEPIRPDVDAFVLNWLKRDPLPRSWFFEQRDGNCRLMSPFASTLSQTAPTWAQLIAPIAEWFAREIGTSKSARRPELPARLTQRYRRVVKGGNPLPVAKSFFKAKKVCWGCGRQLGGDATHCRSCAKPIVIERMTKAARLGRIAALTPEARAKRSATQQLTARARYDWKPADQPDWLTTDFYSKKILPSLVSVSGYSIAKRLKVSNSYANDIRKGRIPHSRHWKSLAELVGLMSVRR